MSDSDNIKILLRKFATRQCSQDEIEELIVFFKKETSSNLLPTVEEVLTLLDRTVEMDVLSADQIFDEIISGRKSKKSSSFSTMGKKGFGKKYVSAAALVLGVFSIIYLYQMQTVDNGNERVSNGLNYHSVDSLNMRSEEITLLLENGIIKVISEDGTSEVMDKNGNVVGKQRGNQLVYEVKNSPEELAYNTLTVPFGKKFELLLSDGTIAHLNAGTSLKYPVTFLPGKERQVFLNGEAFFDVANDLDHPFVINADELNIRVLGTKFNVSTYAEDDVTDVVLVEGSVGLYTESEKFDEGSFLLKPGNKGSFNRLESTITSEIVLTSIYTSWINGELVFRNMTFENILAKLERNYNVSITNENLEMANEKFNASFRNESIEKVLEYFQSVYKLNFTIHGKEIIIH